MDCDTVGHGVRKRNAEIDHISARVSEELGMEEVPSPDEPVPAAVARVGARADQRVEELLEGWW